MNKSITYYITLFVLKLKGIKKTFNTEPIDYKKIRRENVYHPKTSSFKNKKIRSFKISKTSITEIKSKQSSGKLVLFIHGGAFISGPAKHHWDTLHEISKHTNLTIWMCNYPKAPEHKITEISKNIDAIYEKALESYKGTQITLIGDSVGGTLVTAVTQRLIKENKDLPNKIILISPVMDATMSNKTIAIIDKKDPMLSKKGVLSAKKMCAGNTDLKNEIISPIYGSFDKFPKTILFLAENDITYPDQLLAVKKIKKSKIAVDIIIGKKMPHIWPLLPVMKEAKEALKLIIDTINN
ncbi:alpha/beta hydrolase fold domain-containing protein [Tenacibaculum retecalamus]|uniref:alpha/beta hydrolase fold domain-containing protein n=1 Tax=Tenacibaculum retecalamus TaxID=3018315 RepID=UPI0023D96CFA|nr:alpha/beta hydrolase [Tenacibaculum retecalamus]WBX71083.1 alpha/beta hydrolase [Tenacibaculum retecalamus]